jgi:cytochrome c biogenesis protein CcmG/thiol:disulfide interchange protein DsbE
MQIARRGTRFVAAATVNLDLREPLTPELAALRTVRIPFVRLLPALVVVAGLVPYGSSPAEGSEVAPPFVVRSIEGKTVRLTDYRGRPVVLDFWATWCAPCKASMPHLDAMQKRYEEHGLVVLGLSVDAMDARAVRRYTQRMGVTFPMAIANERVLNQYGPIRLIPTTIFINRKGEMIRRVTGYIDAETMESYVLELF